MGRVARWALSAAVAMAVAAAPIPSTFGQQLSQSQIQKQIRDAKQKQEDAKNKIASMKQNIASLHAKAADLTGQLSNIEASLTETQNQIDRKLLEIQQRNQEILQTKQQIAVTQTKLHAQYRVLTNRLRIMYEAGHTNYLAVLFSATNFSDLLSRFHLLTLVAQQDKVVFDSIQQQERHLQVQQANLNVMLGRQRQAYAILLHTQSVQSSQQQEERRLLVQVNSQAAQDQADMNSEQNALSDLGSQIKTLQAQLGAFHPTQPSGPWDWPVPGYYSISSGYGWRQLNGRSDFHPGIDIPAPVGARIVAATAGRVLFAGPANGYGEWIVIDSGNGLLEIYGHMYSNELEVTPGEIVQKGQEIARVGDNGYSTGPHLHFEVATGIGSDGIPTSTDPTPYVGH